MSPLCENLRVSVAGRILVTAIVIFCAGLVASSAAAQTACLESGGTERFNYEWRLRGGLSWLARLAIPTSGTGVMETLPAAEEGMLSSALVIKASSRDDYYRYESEIDPSKTMTTMTYHAYIWGRKERHDRTWFDYENGVARRRREKEESVKTVTSQIPETPLMDILTGIQYLRGHAHEITKPFDTEIYSDGNLYAVTFKPAPRENISFEGKVWPSKCFEIGAAKDAEKRWGGGLKVCVTDDSRRIPLLISIRTGHFVSFELKLTHVETCDAGESKSVAEKLPR